MKIELFNNVNGFGIRQNIVAILPAPCLEWIQRIIEKYDVQCIVNRTDCNDPKEFEQRVRKLMHHCNVVSGFIIEMGCGSFNSKEFDHLPISRIDLSMIQIDDFENIFMEQLSSVKNQVSHLKTSQGIENILIGLKCGGSTRESQYTMNTFVGRCVDKMIDMGFRFVFNEPQESQGQEDFYRKRTDAGSFGRWKQFMDELNIEKKYMNKGNKEGGIKDIYEKSIGALRKVGQAHQFEVVDKNDTSESALYQILGTNQEPESFTQMTLQGAHCHIYLTGLGGIFGTAVAPSYSISMSSNNMQAFDFNYQHGLGSEEDFINGVLSFVKGTPSYSERLKINLI